jgi:hypothetical protein
VTIMTKYKIPAILAFKTGEISEIDFIIEKGTTCLVSSGRLLRLTSQVSHDPSWRGACASTTRDSWGRCAVAPGSAYSLLPFL